MNKAVAFASVVILFALALSACGGGETLTAPPPPDTPEPSATNTTAPEPTDTPAPVELPETPSSATLGAEPSMTYKVAMGISGQLEFDESELPVPPGSVEAHWYTSGGRYVVAYVGLDLSASGPLCPGNSIQTAAGFVFASNAPTDEGACEGFSTLTTDPDVGPLVCQETVLYVTAIPSDEQGTLYGTLEKLADGGTAIIGLTSTSQSSPDIPDIDLDEFCQ